VSQSHSVDWFHQLPQNIVIGLQQGSLYALVALGYTLVYGVLQLINFAHSEVFMSGAFGSYLVVNGIVGKRHISGVMVPVTIVAGVLSGALVGAAIAWLLEKVAYKPLRRSSPAECISPENGWRSSVPPIPGPRGRSDAPRSRRTRGSVAKPRARARVELPPVQIFVVVANTSVRT